MHRMITFTAAAAVALCFAASAAYTDASAASATKAFKAHRHIGTHHKSAGHSSGNTGCWEAECGGHEVPIDDTYVMRLCNAGPGGEAVPPWCEDLPGSPSRAGPAFRR